MESHVKRNMIFALLSVIVLVVFCVMVYNYRSNASDEKSNLEAAVAEAKPYEDEVTQLKRSITKAADELSNTSDTARFVVGFVIKSEDDIAYAEEEAAEYGFDPLLVIDCTDSLSELQSLADVASDSGHEIMLTASYFSDDTNETIKSLMTYMDGNSIEFADIFLLRGDYYGDSIVEMIISDGFAGYTVYNSTPTSGMTDEGYITFDYSYLTVDSNSFSRFSSSYSNKASMVVALDMDSIRSGTLSESFALGLLDVLSSYAENEDCEFSSIAEVESSVLEDSELMETKLAEYEAYVAECEERIAELEEIIAEIYARFD